MIVFSVDLLVNASVGSLFAMAELVIVEKTIIPTKNVREINNVQVPHSRVGLVTASEIYVFPDRHVVMA